MAFPLAAAAIAGGLITGGVGSYLQGRAANKAGKDARDFYSQQTGAGASRYLSSFLGPQGALDYFSMSQGPQLSAARQQEIAQLQEQIQGMQSALTQRRGGDGGGGILGRPRSGSRAYPDTSAEIAKLQQRLAEVTQAGWEEAHQQYGQSEQGYLDKIGGPLFDQYRAISDTGLQQIQNQRALSTNLYNQARGQDAAAVNLADASWARAENTAQGYGQGRERDIRRDSAERQKSLDQQSRASLAGLGANSLVANQLQSNATQVGRETDRALTDLRMGQAQVVGQAQQARAGATQQAREDQMRRMFSSIPQQLGHLGSLTQMQAALSQDPLARLQGVQSSSILNPWLGQSTSQYYPGVSPAGLATSTLSSPLTALGGYGMENPEALRSLFR